MLPIRWVVYFKHAFLPLDVKNSLVLLSSFTSPEVTEENGMEATIEQRKSPVLRSDNVHHCWMLRVPVLKHIRVQTCICPVRPSILNGLYI